MGGPSSGSTAGSRRANCARRVATVMARNPEGPDLDLPRLWHGPRPGPQRSQEHPGGRAGRYCLWTRCKTQPKPGGRGRNRNHPGRYRISPVRNPRPSGRGGSQLPTLYGAYSRREVQLLALDDLSDEAATPVGFLEAGHAGGGAEAVAAAFADWERWCDEVYDSHTACPMLALFRSRQPGQHWLTALVAVMDAAAICVATVEGSRAGPAARLLRRGTRLVQNLSGLPATGEAEVAAAFDDEGRFRAGYQRLAALGLPLRPYEQAWSDLRGLRAGFLPQLVAATRLLLVPLEFRHHSARLDITRSG